jgi:hypothetical protein
MNYGISQPATERQYARQVIREILGHPVRSSLMGERPRQRMDIATDILSCRTPTCIRLSIRSEAIDDGPLKEDRERDATRRIVPM